MHVVIGIDPHKASHTAVAVGGGEEALSCVKVRATRKQVDQLLDWAEPFEKRRWAIESAGGLGYLLAQQLVARGEEVFDVPPTLASRVRVLATTRSNKNDANDALSIAVAALLLPGSRRWSQRITPRCCGWCPSATPTSALTGLEWCAGSMPSSKSSLRAELPRK